MSSFSILVFPDAEEHIQSLSARDRVMVLTRIEHALRYEPDVQTRNRKSLRPNTLSGWELRVGTHRVFYDIDPEARTVSVIAVGTKKGNRLVIGGREFELR